MIENLRSAAFKPVDIASLVVFRIAVGLILFLEVAEYLTHGWVHSGYIKPEYFFPFLGFEWVVPWPGQWMYVHFIVMGLCGLAIMVGYRYRLASWLGGILFGLFFLMDRTHYLNHFYLFTLIICGMACVPAHRSFSMDAAQSRVAPSSTIPAWCLWLAQFHVFIPYFFGGIAKIQPDWMFHAEPMRVWLQARTHFPFVGHLFEHEWMIYLMSWSGLLFDLLVVPLLIWKRTRVLAYVLALSFHFSNMILFNIGMFPWFMILGTTIFFEPDWPRRFLARLGAVWPAQEDRVTPKVKRKSRNKVLLLFGLYALFHCVFPFRHLLYPGNVLWTLEGYEFSWRMKLTEVNVNLTMHQVDSETKRRSVINVYDYLTKKQAREMAWRPRMMQRFAHHVATEVRNETGRDIQVYVEAQASLNGRPYQTFIKPTVDLAAEPISLRRADWIVPLSTEIIPPSERGEKKGTRKKVDKPPEVHEKAAATDKKPEITVHATREDS